MGLGTALLWVGAVLVIIGVGYYLGSRRASAPAADMPLTTAALEEQLIPGLRDGEPVAAPEPEAGEDAAAPDEESSTEPGSRAPGMVTTPTNLRATHPSPVTLARAEPPPDFGPLAHAGGGAAGNTNAAAHGTLEFPGTLLNSVDPSFASNPTDAAQSHP